MSLSVTDLYKRFGAVTALDGMSFTAPRGQLFGFVGSNGAGKTTTMRIILGVLEADSGTVENDGEPISREDRSRFGYMPEERGLYPKMTVADQLIYLARLHGLSRAEAEKQMNYWVERLQVAQHKQHFVQTLSLGNQQRVQLAAALVHNPSVLILDEPFSGLDPLAVNAMSSVLKEKARDGATVLFSSHQLDLVERLCDSVGICTHGKIVAHGSIEDLRTTAHAYYDLQTSADPRLLTQHLAQTGDISAQILDSHTLRVKLPAGVDDQQLLHAALEVGSVHRFERFRPHLNELFANVVHADSLNADSTAQKESGKRSSLLSRFLSPKKAS